MAEIRRNRKQLGQYLVEKEIITHDQLKEALEEQRKTGLFLREIFLKLGYVSEDDIISFFEEELNITTVQLSDYAIDQTIIDLIPEKLARRFRAIALFRIRDTLTVAMEDPLNVTSLDEISSVTGLDVDPCICKKDDIASTLRRYYGAENRFEMLDAEATPGGFDGREMDNQVEEFVDNMIHHAVTNKASGIHFEPDENVLRVRMRVDGVLKEVVSQPLSIHPAVVTRIKVLSELDIAEKQAPQYGRFRMRMENRLIDFRVSTFPTIHGENTVIRLLDKTNAVRSLEELGLNMRDLKLFKGLISRPNGLMLVAGPSGSGKTTTLYAALQAINPMERNIMTLEDPVEYPLPLIQQTQVNEDVGLTFAKGLRSLVRQDPDVLMVGEIRDYESAEIAMRTALTGRFVLSTIYTNNAMEAIARLLDMGIEPFLLASSLVGVVAQQLLRRTCANCAERGELQQTTLEELHIQPKGNEERRCGHGCLVCGGTGYQGRIAIYEIMEMNETVRTAVLEGAASGHFKEIIRENGMKTFREDGLEKAAAGITTIEEVIRVTKQISQTPLTGVGVDSI